MRFTANLSIKVIRVAVTMRYLISKARHQDASSGVRRDVGSFIERVSRLCQTATEELFQPPNRGNVTIRKPHKVSFLSIDILIIFPLTNRKFFFYYRCGFLSNIYPY